MEYFTSIEDQLSTMPGIGTIHILALAFIAHASGKTYERCELARELNERFEVPIDEVATWVCIAEHESQYNTSAVGMVNGDYSNDHGIFQINDEFWCSPPGKGYACGLTCAELEDDDIADDFACVRKIFDEHKILSGNGFNAWAVYQPFCKTSRVSKYIDGCFNSTTDPPAHHQKKKTPTKKVYPWLLPRPSSTTPPQEPASEPFDRSGIDENSATAAVSPDPRIAKTEEEDTRRPGKFHPSFGTPFSTTSTGATPIAERVIPEFKSTGNFVQDFPKVGKIDAGNPRSSISPSSAPRVGTVPSPRTTPPPAKALPAIRTTFPVTPGSGIGFSRSPSPPSPPTSSASRFIKPSTSKIDLLEEALPTLNRGIPIEHYKQRESSFRINGRVWL